MALTAAQPVLIKDQAYLLYNATFPVQCSGQDVMLSRVTYSVWSVLHTRIVPSYEQFPHSSGCLNDKYLLGIKLKSFYISSTSSGNVCVETHSHTNTTLPLHNQGRSKILLYILFFNTTQRVVLFYLSFFFFKSNAAQIMWKRSDRVFEIHMIL